MTTSGAEPAVRRGVATDLPRLLRLIREFYDHEGYAHTDEHILGALPPLLEDDVLGQVWVVVVEGTVVGYAVLTWGWGLESGGRESLLDELYLARRGEGLGGLLLERVVAEARAGGAKTLFLETEADREAARRFYTRHGFATEDSVWMSLRF
jgi:GNAT superfamily N-acetyltransferase